MNKLLVKWFSLPWYPIAFGAYPALALLAANVYQVDLGVVFRPLVISLAASSLVFILFRLFIRDWHHAAFPSVVVVLLFFTYGHVYNYFKTLDILGFPLGRHRLLLAIWIVLAVLSIWLVMRKAVNFANQTPTINLIVFALLIFPLYTIVSHEFSVRDALQMDSQPVTALNVDEDQSLPDIYYIILDSYTRSDVLKEVYGYDNSLFLKDLKEMGFYVAECSTSNYMWTRLSVSSTLNMQYLQEIPAYVIADNRDVITEELLKHSLVRKDLESLGYQTVAFATGFPFNELTDAHIYLEPPSLVKNIREFDALLIQTTLLRVLQDFDLIKVNQTATARYRDRTLFAISQFDELARMGGPKFVYVHIITPHPPFVFGPNGEVVDPKDFVSNEGQYTDETYVKGYIDQVEFISGRIAASVRTLLADSAIPPVIIIQGDHGPWKQDGENRVRILNAYYLPGRESVIKPDISPVNTFRVVFNEYFNTDYPLLVNFSYSSPYANVYDFTLQPTSCTYDK